MQKHPKRALHSVPRYRVGRYLNFQNWQYWWWILSGKFYTSGDFMGSMLSENVWMRLGIYSWVELWHVFYQKVQFLLIEKSFFENFHIWWWILSGKCYTSGDSIGPKLSRKVHIRLGIWPMWNFYFIRKPFFAKNGSNCPFSNADYSETKSPNSKIFCGICSHIS